MDQDQINMRIINSPFYMKIMDVFEIPGRGTIVTGKIEKGDIQKGDELIILSANTEIKTTALELEVFRKTLEYATVDDQVGIALANVEKSQIAPGFILLKPTPETP